MKHFRGSLVFAIIGLILVFLWSHQTHPGAELSGLFIAIVLSVLEISLSFDNAVVNASKLEKMSPKWQHRFLTWGIFIAVFGMRFLFPIVVVAVFSKLDIIKVINMALNSPKDYAFYLHSSHPMIIAYGASFLIMLFFTFFFNSKKNIHWIGFVEKPLLKLGKIKGINIILTVILLLVSNCFIAIEQRKETLIAGVFGIITYILIDGVSMMLENRAKKRQSCTNSKRLINSCFINFLYLELIDASFSLDGVLGAFALSMDIVIITIGLSIGAMFVRSLTLLLVEKRTLKEYIYLESGAHWAIGALAIIMFISSFKEVSEIITGFIGLFFIISAFICSIRENKKTN